MGVSGLAEGFLAGFGTMNHYQRGQKADERAEKEQGLRDAMWQNNLDRQRQSDERYADETTYARQRDNKQDEREARRDDLNEEQVRSSIASTKAANARAARADSRAEVEYQWLKDRREKEAYQQEHLPVIQQGWMDIEAGKDPGDVFRKVVSDPKAAQYSPERYMESEFTGAGKTFVNYTKGLMSDAESGKLDWNSEEGVNRINNSEFLKAAGTLYQEEIKTGIGDVDPATGKTIKNKELGRIMVTPDGAGVVLGLKVTYDDGSTADRPVTDNRTARGDDKPKVIPISDFVGTGYKRAALSHDLVAKANNIRTSLGLTPGADVKGYRQAVVKLQADTDKAIGQIRRDTMLSQEERETAIAAERDAAQQQAQGLRDVFGLEAQAQVPATAAGAGSEPAPSGLTQWVGNDALRREFVQEAGANGKSITEHADPAMLDQIYSRWVQLRRDGQTANAMRGEPTPAAVAQQDPRAAEKAALNALADPFNTTPHLNKAPDGLAAYQAMVK
ncbi:hypothetical protein [Aeromonas eucrenophila]|uniref:Uncharacterized protein n=1 Tax=Aeromonas eucrenophila TaxID=649 RepID=A0ABW0YHS0_9GAMM|nr:hypothetical protein [Aeromonas eucrenophila]